MYNKLERIFSVFLGESARGVSENGQCQYDCIFCNSGKKNLEVSFSKSLFNSWCCPEYSGRLSYLIRQFGNGQILKEYYDEVRNIRESRLYLLNPDNNIEDFGETILELPRCCQPIDKNNKFHSEAYQYLIGRALDDDLIKEHNIHCTGNSCKKCTPGCSYGYKLQNRIIFPNYSFGMLDYWVGRLYKESKYQTKYLLPSNTNKKNIIWGCNRIFQDSQIRLCEGVFDSIFIPSSLPLLGKKLNSNFKLFHFLIEKAYSVCLIPDNETNAYNDFMAIGYILNYGKLKDKITIVNWDQLEVTNECKDVADLYQKFGKKGVIDLLKTQYVI